MGNVIRCYKCDQVIGELVEKDGGTLLRIGMIEVYRIHGNCACGAQLHWDSGEVRLQRLIKRAQRDRDIIKPTE